MKRIFSFVVLVVLALGAMAQSPVVRNGNHYLVDGQNMSQREFKGYLQNTCPEAFSKFRSGYNTATAGWVLFAGGLGLEAGGLVTSIVGSFEMVNSSETDPTVNGGVVAGPLMYVLGGLVTTSSIVCLAVGYARMHNTVDVYNVSCAKRPVAEFRLTTGANGVGIACRF